MKNKKLFFIPARKGSKGLPQKNILPFSNTSLIEIAVRQALKCKEKEDIICVSTNDQIAIQIVEKIGLKVPFKRPEHLSTDNAAIEDAIHHALEYYKNFKITFDSVIILQPSSPLRNLNDIKKVIEKYNVRQGMILTVNESKYNPYFNLIEEDSNGNFFRSKNVGLKNRQELPKCYAINGAVYIVPVQELLKKTLSDIDIIGKVIMPIERSIDIDTKWDWDLALLQFERLNEKS